MDYSLQQWSKADFGVRTTDESIRGDFDETYAYCDRSKISVGAEYIPNLLGRSYLAHIKYRLGAYYTTPYYKINGKKATREYGVTAGFGLPVPPFTLYPQYQRTVCSYQWTRSDFCERKYLPRKYRIDVQRTLVLQA